MCISKAFRKIIQVNMLLLGALTTQAQSVFINELIYDSKRLVNGKFENTVEPLVEIAGPAGTDLKDWSLVLYDGKNTQSAEFYTTKAISGVIPDQQNGYGTLAFRFPPNSFQSGPNDGMAVVDAAGKVVQLVSYEGAFTAGNGPAKGMASDRIGPVHSATNGMQSLQLKGKGRVYKDFKWSPLFDFTPGAVNNKFINEKQQFVKP